MRTTTVMLATMVFVTPAFVSPAAAEEARDQQAGPAFEAELSVAFSEEGFSPDSALALTEKLRATASLDDFRLSLDVTKDTVKGGIKARFGFDSLPELAEWQESDSVQSLLQSLEQISDGQVRINISGQLNVE